MKTYDVFFMGRHMATVTAASADKAIAISMGFTGDESPNDENGPPEFIYHTARARV